MWDKVGTIWEKRKQDQDNIRTFIRNNFEIMGPPRSGAGVDVSMLRGAGDSPT